MSNWKPGQGQANQSDQEREATISLILDKLMIDTSAWAAIDRLPIGQRAAVLAAASHDYVHASDYLNIAADTVKNHLDAARRSLGVDRPLLRALAIRYAVETRRPQIVIRAEDV